jgi:hypothetical protein
MIRSASFAQTLSSPAVSERERRPVVDVPGRYDVLVLVVLVLVVSLQSARMTNKSPTRRLIGGNQASSPRCGTFAAASVRKAVQSSSVTRDASWMGTASPGAWERTAALQGFPSCVRTQTLSALSS